ncbi:MAG: N-acetyl sugar amidotransferase [Bacteroidales bacterium]|nr:N-acetyl sugar amidotransferase [Bacteroidales bacterium]
MREYKICSRCVMDTSDPDIVFDENGCCNHCTNVLQHLKENYSEKTKNQEKLNEIIRTVKKEGFNRKYDCIIGLSGGVDSSYLAYKLVRDYGIRPLAVHVDNGWNSELAVSNIHNLVNKLNIDLYTHVINWEEFKDLQKSFLFASVVDLEMLSDHAIVVAIKKIAKRERIEYFLIGSNYQTESILPVSWFYPNKIDSGNIIDIYRKYGSGRKIKTFPFLSFWNYFFYGKGHGKYLMPLSLMEYDKDAAKTILIKEMDWQDYGAKHHESFITKFYQTYILPNKFGIDKRRAHLASLICANQITREKALEELNKPILEDSKKGEAIEYFCKKMELSREEFNKIMMEPRREHDEFKTYKKTKESIWKIIRIMRHSQK